MFGYAVRDSTANVTSSEKPTGDAKSIKISQSGFALAADSIAQACLELGEDYTFQFSKNIA